MSLRHPWGGGARLLQGGLAAGAAPCELSTAPGRSQRGTSPCAWGQTRTHRRGVSSQLPGGSPGRGAGAKALLGHPEDSPQGSGPLHVPDPQHTPFLFFRNHALKHVHGPDDHAKFSEKKFTGLLTWDSSSVRVTGIRGSTLK